MSDFVVQTAKLPLTRGAIALLDEADWPLVAGKRWHAVRYGRGFMAEHSFWDAAQRKRQNVHLHRLVMGAQSGQIVDHINGNPLDNRRANLRFATARQNSVNKKAVGVSRFLGVSKVKGHWTAQVQTDGLSIVLGRFADEEKAAAAYNRAALRIHGHFVRLNAVPALSEDEWQEILEQKRIRLARQASALHVLEGA